MDFAIACLSSWLASAQWNLSLDRRRDLREELVKLHIARGFFQAPVVEAANDESNAISRKAGEHLIVVCFAVSEMDGVLVPTEPICGHADLVFPSLVLD